MAVSIADIWQVLASRAKHIDSSLPSRPVPPRPQRLLAAFVCIHQGILPGALSGTSSAVRYHRPLYLICRTCSREKRFPQMAFPVVSEVTFILPREAETKREKKGPKPRRLLLVQGYLGCGLRRSVAWRYRSQNKLRQGLGGLGKPSWQTTT